MHNISSRAEEIAAHLVEYGSGAHVAYHDIDGRQAAVDFHLFWEDGRRGALEVTLIMDSRSKEWQGLAMRDGWRWPSASSWEFRPRDVSFRYKKTRSSVLRIIRLCDEWGAASPSDLPSEVIAEESQLSRFLMDEVGSLRRTPFSPGVVIYPPVRADFITAEAHDFVGVVESWLAESHVNAHIEKLARSGTGREHHLFLIPTDDILPAQYFTDDFEVPVAHPKGYESVDVLWIWSNYWHRCLVYTDESWHWKPFPPVNVHDQGQSS